MEHMPQRLAAAVALVAIVGFVVVALFFTSKMYGDVPDIIKSCKEVGGFVYRDQIFKCADITPLEKLRYR